MLLCEQRRIKEISNNMLHVKAHEKHNRESSRIIHQEHTCTGDWEGVEGGVELNQH